MKKGQRDDKVQLWKTVCTKWFIRSSFTKMGMLTEQELNWDRSSCATVTTFIVSSGTHSWQASAETCKCRSSKGLFWLGLKAVGLKDVSITWFLESAHTRRGYFSRVSKGSLWLFIKKRWGWLCLIIYFYRNFYCAYWLGEKISEINEIFKNKMFVLLFRSKRNVTQWITN